MNVVHGDKEAVDAARARRRQGDFLRRLHPDCEVRLRDRHRQRQARPGSRWRQEPHARPLPDADLDLAADAAINAGFGSADWRCMAISALIAVEPIADELIDKIKERMAKLRTGDGTRNPTWVRLSPRSTATRSRPTRPGVEAVPSCSSTVARATSTPGRRGSSCARRSSTRSRRACRSGRRDLWPGPVGRARRLPTTRPRCSTTTLRQRRGALHQRRWRARRFQNEVEVGMVGINVPIPSPSPSSPSAAGRPRSSATATPTAWRVSTSTPRQGHHLPLARPESRRHQPGLPQNLLSRNSSPRYAARSPRAGGIPTSDETWVSECSRAACRHRALSSIEAPPLQRGILGTGWIADQFVGAVRAHTGR